MKKKRIISIEQILPIVYNYISLSLLNKLIIILQESKLQKSGAKKVSKRKRKKESNYRELKLPLWPYICLLNNLSS